MYHYYVRFSSFLKATNEKVGEGVVEIWLNQEISQFSHIEYVKKEILKKMEFDNNYDILIDFYQLLRKDPD